MRYARFFVLTAAFLMPGLAFGQNQGIQGVVEDLSGKPLEAVRITPSCPRAEATPSTDTDLNGRFLVSGQSVTPGMCKVTILKTGFETETREIRVRLGFTEDIGRLRLRRVGEKTSVAVEPQLPSRDRQPERAPVTPGPGSVFVTLKIQSLAHTSADDTDYVEAWMRPCITEHLLPLISERGWSPAYLGVVQPPSTKGQLTIDYTESLGAAYFLGGRGVHISARIRLTDPVAGMTVWNETLSASTSPTVSMRLGTSLYTDALENLREACRSFRTRVSANVGVTPPPPETAQLPPFRGSRWLGTTRFAFVIRTTSECEYRFAPDPVVRTSRSSPTD
jgi:hypothetical protein